MNTKNYQTIQTLVERFSNQIDSYQQSSYNETQTRREFIDSFFTALGWDVINEQGYAEAYKDVVHEEALKIGRATKAPDYSFRIGGVRKFFLEAKKPSVKLKDNAEAAFQVRRYGWSAKLPLSLLTNFAELAVYDCRIKPAKTDSAEKARIFYLTYPDYLTHWEKLVGIFSREAILTGAFDKYIDSQTSKKGTATVDTAFLAEIEHWREMLARNLALRNPNLTPRQLNFAVQQTIDRLIFLRICEDRGIEDYGRLLALPNGPHIYARLFQLFRDADQRYNSGLFHFQTEKQRDNPDTLTPSLIIDDKILKEILTNLYYPDSPYEFSVLPTDILGQIYEQFLGKVIRLTPAHRAVVEEKPEVKKAGGVYYTPTYIVDYIVKQTVGQLVETKKPNQVSQLKILDPACGSGSFLLGAYQFLLDWHSEHYRQNPKKWAVGKNPRLYQTPGGWQLTIAERKRILLNNIYGVDVDPQAVEVTKLSLLLKVLEDEQLLFPQLSLFKERVLPDLDNNIKCGNSLIGSDFYQGQQLGLLDEETLYQINAFDWATEFADIFKEGGFDAVIGNPPYGAFLSQPETHYLDSHFQLQNYQLDTYLLFFEKVLDLTNEEGYVGLIIPNTWLLNLKCHKIRKYLFNHTTIRNIVHYQHRVFNKATVDTEIVIIQKQLPIDIHQINITLQEGSDFINHTISQKRWQMAQGEPVNIFEKPELIPIAEKLRVCPKLDDLTLITQGAKPFQVGKGKPPQTREIVKNKPYVSETPFDNTFRPLLRGSLIQRYEILWNNNYWISFGDWLAEPRYSAHYEAASKIVIRQTGYRLVATLDCHQFIVRDNLYTIVSHEDQLDLRFLLGLINSRLLQWFYSTIINPEQGEALAQVKRGHLAQLPIALVDLNKSTDKTNHDQIVKLVEQMLALNKQLATTSAPQTKTILKRQIDATDKQIDELVYQLYDLTAEEIEIIEK
jgi:hypothetical protein